MKKMILLTCTTNETLRSNDSFTLNNVMLFRNQATVFPCLIIQQNRQLRYITLYILCKLETIRRSVFSSKLEYVKQYFSRAHNGFTTVQPCDQKTNPVHIDWDHSFEQSNSNQRKERFCKIIITVSHPFLAI